MFADFYAELYQSIPTATSFKLATSRKHWDVLPAVTAEELMRQLQAMSKGKASDRQGLVIEMIQGGIALLLQLIANVFSELLEPDLQAPDSWR